MKSIGKIVFVAKSIDGGTGTYLKSMQFFKKTHTIQTVVFDPPQFRDAPHHYVFVHQKEQTLSDSYFNIFSSLKAFLNDVRFFYIYIHSFRPDIVLSVDIYANIITLIVRVMSPKKYKIITTTHNYLSMTIYRKSHKMIAGIVHLLVRLLYTQAEKNIAVSEGVGKDLTEKFQVPSVEVIQNGVGLNKTIHHPFGGVIVSVGRLVEQKDHNTLIQAFLYAHTYNKQLKLWIVGDGPQREKIISKIKDLGLQDSVKMLGWRKDVGRIFDRADICAHASHWEGFPYVLLEAMSHGLPVVATDSLYGIHEILEGGKMGLLVKPGDATEMGTALLQLAQDARKRAHFRQQARRKIVKLSVRSMILKYVGIVGDLVS